MQLDRRDACLLTAAASCSFCVPHEAAAEGDLQWKRGALFPREAMYYEHLEGGKIQCGICPRRCVVEKGERGFCATRENRKGRYVALAHANPCAVHVDPVEKKPFFHVLPGTMSFSVATAGCNLRCKFCQNWKISQTQPDLSDNIHLEGVDVAALAGKYQCPSITATYVEPTIFFEYELEMAKAAHEKDLLYFRHSNGYINPEPLKELCHVLDAACIDLKGFSEDYYHRMSQGRLQPVLDSLRMLKSMGVWVEVVNLVVPGWNDSPKMLRALCKWVARELSVDTPLHFSRFFPLYKLKQLPPTPVATLDLAWKIAREEGLRFVYVGNVPGHPAVDTVCPQCGKTLIRRKGFFVEENLLVDGCCPKCHEVIPGIFSKKRPPRTVQGKQGQGSGGDPGRG